MAFYENSCFKVFSYLGMTIDISEVVEDNGPDTLLEKFHIDKWFHMNSPLPDKFVLLVRFGWSQYHGIERSYFGLKNKTSMHFPGMFTFDFLYWGRFHKFPKNHFNMVLVFEKRREFIS